MRTVGVACSAGLPFSAFLDSALQHCASLHFALDQIETFRCWQLSSGIGGASCGTLTTSRGKPLSDSNPRGLPTARSLLVGPSKRTNRPHPLAVDRSEGNINLWLQLQFLAACRTASSSWTLCKSLAAVVQSVSRRYQASMRGIVEARDFKRHSCTFLAFSLLSWGLVWAAQALQRCKIGNLCLLGPYRRAFGRNKTAAPPAPGRGALDLSSRCPCSMAAPPVTERRPFVHHNVRYASLAGNLLIGPAVAPGKGRSPLARSRRTSWGQEPTMPPAGDGFSLRQIISHVNHQLDRGFKNGSARPTPAQVRLARALVRGATRARTPRTSSRSRLWCRMPSSSP